MFTQQDIKDFEADMAFLLSEKLSANALSVEEVQMLAKIALMRIDEDMEEKTFWKVVNELRTEHPFFEEVVQKNNKRYALQP